MRFFQALVERGAQRAGTAANFARHSEDGIECPWRAIVDTFVGVIGWVEDGDENMATGEESSNGRLGNSKLNIVRQRLHMEKFPCFRIRYETLRRA